MPSDDAMVLRKRKDCIVHVMALLGEGVGGNTCLCLPPKDDESININDRGQRSWWQEEKAMDKKRWRPRQTGGGGARRGGGREATTSQGGQQEAVAR